MDNSSSKFSNYLTMLRIYKSSTVDSYVQAVDNLASQINLHLRNPRIGSLYNIKNSKDLRRIYNEWISKRAVQDQERIQHNKYTNAFKRYIEYIENEENKTKYREETDELLKKAGFKHVQKTGSILMPVSKKQIKDKKDPENEK